MGKTIEQIYENNKLDFKDDKKALEYMNRINKNLSIISRNITKEEKIFLDELLSDFNDIVYYVDKTAFIKGLKLGAQITHEILFNKP